MVPDPSAEFRALVESYSDPYLGQTLGAARAVDLAELKGDRAHVRVALGFPVGGYEAEFTRDLTAHVAAGGGPRELDVELTAKITAHAVQRQLSPLAGVRNVVAVASGKGGVGKSTVAANLALAWARQGARVGLLDADIYGPSQPIMLGLTGQRPASPDGKRIKPLAAHGLVAMSIGFLIDPEQPMVWRGPMVTQALTQLLGDTEWGDLDYLVIDMPPGTGDISISLSQFLPRAQVLIVTTPQLAAQRVARRAALMAKQVDQEVIGIVENMSWFTADDGTRYELFGSGGGQMLAEEVGVDLMARIPLLPAMGRGADEGEPVAVVAPGSEAAEAFDGLADAVVEKRPRIRTNPALTIQ